MQGTRMAKTILGGGEERENKLGRFNLPEFKTYYKGKRYQNQDSLVLA